MSVSPVNSALVGCSGFVGGLLQRQQEFAQLYRSINIASIQGCAFDLVVCAAAPAQKWIANRAPAEDAANIEALISSLKSVAAKRFILISTVDVFAIPDKVDESTPVNEDALHPYGLNRRRLEKFVEEHFEEHLIVRLPGLVGPGLRKNVIFDLLNDNNLYAIDSRGVFQFYPMVNLWHDLQLALTAGLKLVHLTAEPVSVADIASQGFNKPFKQTLASPPAGYDLRSRHAELFGGTGLYQYSRRESIQAIRAYAQSEPRTLKLAEGSGS
jgi:dTDP-4-dehydrorhamnose reductase